MLRKSLGFEMLAARRSRSLLGKQSRHDDVESIKPSGTADFAEITLEQCSQHVPRGAN